MQELSLHILDVAENALQAGATRIEIIIEEDLVADQLIITVRDNGCGMSPEQLARINDPFFTTRTTRHVGLGIPLFKAAAEQCNGNLTVESRPGVGTTLRAIFQHSHIDRAPIGDIASTLLAIILADRARGEACDPPARCDVHYVHRVKTPESSMERTFELDTAEIRAQLGESEPGAPDILAHPAVCSWLRKLITDEENNLR